jgi:hypothetical protein
MTDPPQAATQAALARLLEIMSDAQVCALVEQIIVVAEYGYGEVTLTWDHGQAHMIRASGTVKLR